MMWKKQTDSRNCDKEEIIIGGEACLVLIYIQHNFHPFMQFKYCLPSTSISPVLPQILKFPRASGSSSTC